MEIENILRIILFLTVAGAGAVGLRVVKDYHIEMPKSSAEFSEVSRRISEKMPETALTMWNEDVVPAVEEWFSSNVAPKAGDFYEEEIKPKVEDEITRQQDSVKEAIGEKADEIEEKVPFLGDVLDAISGNKTCRWVCE